MSDQTAITIYCPATRKFNSYSKVIMLTPEEANEDRYVVVGVQERNHAELTVIFRTCEEIIADVQSTLLSAGGLWIQHGHCFERGCINNGL